MSEQEWRKYIHFLTPYPPLEELSDKYFLTTLGKEVLAGIQRNAGEISVEIIPKINNERLSGEKTHITNVAATDQFGAVYVESEKKIKVKPSDFATAIYYDPAGNIHPFTQEHGYIHEIGHVALGHKKGEIAATTSVEQIVSQLAMEREDISLTNCWLRSEKQPERGLYYNIQGKLVSLNDPVILNFNQDTKLELALLSSKMSNCVSQMPGGGSLPGYVPMAFLPSPAIKR